MAGSNGVTGKKKRRRPFRKEKTVGRDRFGIVRRSSPSHMEIIMEIITESNY